MTGPPLFLMPTDLINVPGDSFVYQSKVPAWIVLSKSMSYIEPCSNSASGLLPSKTTGLPVT